MGVASAGSGRAGRGRAERSAAGIRSAWSEGRGGRPEGRGLVVKAGGGWGWLGVARAGWGPEEPSLGVALAGIEGN